MIGDLNPENNSIVWTKIYDPNAPNKSISGNIQSGEISQSNQLRLYPNEPNPFLSETSIRFNLPNSDEVLLKVYDLNGRLLMTQNNVFPKGINEMVVNSRDVSQQGVLIYKIETKSVFF